MDSTHGPFVDGRSYRVSEMDTKAVHIGRRPKCRRYPSIGREVPKAQRRLVALEASRLKAGLLNEISIRPTLTRMSINSVSLHLLTSSLPRDIQFGII